MISLDGNTLTIDEVIRAARRFEKVEINEAGRRQVAVSREVVEKLLAYRVWQPQQHLDSSGGKGEVAAQSDFEPCRRGR